MASPPVRPEFDVPELDARYPLPASARAELGEHGHLTLRGVLEAAEITAVRSAVHRAAARVPALEPTATEGEAYARAFRQHTNLWRVDPGVARFTLAPRLARLAAELLGVVAVRLYHDQALFKLPGGSATPWHQDKHYWPIDQEMLTLWMPLVDLEPDMGELHFARGSHLGGALSDHPISAASQDELAALVRRRGHEVVGTGAMRAGDVSVHLAWTAHAAGANATATCREAMTVIWMPDGAHVLPPATAGQRADLSTWLPGLQPGDLAASALNPRAPAPAQTPPPDASAVRR
ncbi:MAG: phytanoyl-CoA dioxygenase family protein [Planctomycetota bacterium]